MTAPKGEKGEPGTSVNIVGEIEGIRDYIPSSYNKVDAPIYAIRSPFCLYWWEESRERFMQEVPEEGSGYLVSDIEGSDTSGCMYVAVGGKWKGPLRVQGPPGKDGTNGKDAAFFRLKITEGWARWKYRDSDGDYVLEAAASGVAKYVKGNEELPLSSAQGYEEFKVTYVFYGRRTRTDLCDLANDGSWTAPDAISGWERSSWPTLNHISVELEGNKSGFWELLDTASIPIVKDGEKGHQGAIGPLGIPAGSYNSAARYTRTEQVAPVVEHNGEYWYPAAVGTLSGSEPSASNTDWKKAENFEVMFTKIFFTEFGKLGSWVFSGDYMLSQENEAGETNYEEFTGEEGSWQPRLYINAKTGRLVGGDVALKGSFVSENKQKGNTLKLDSSKMVVTGPMAVNPNTDEPMTESREDLIKMELGKADYDKFMTVRNSVLKLAAGYSYGSIELNSFSPEYGPCISIKTINREILLTWNGVTLKQGTDPDVHRTWDSIIYNYK